MVAADLCRTALGFPASVNASKRWAASCTEKFPQERGSSSRFRRFSMSIRVVIAEDQAMVLGALAALLEMAPDIQVVGKAKNGTEAFDLTLRHKPDILLTDIEMPEMSGLEVAGRLKELSAPVRVIILTTFARAGYLRRALDAGAAGYLLKDSPAETLADAVRRVHAGCRAVDPELAAEAWSEPDPLSDRERQVLRLAADGSTSSDRNWYDLRSRHRPCRRLHRGRHSVRKKGVT